MSWTDGNFKQRETKPEQSNPVACLLTAELSVRRFSGDETSQPARPAAIAASNDAGPSNPPHS